MGKLGMLHCSNGALENGESLLRQAIDVFGTSLSDSHWRTAEARYELAGCLVLRCRYEDAERELLAAYQGLESGLGKAHPRTVRVLKRLVDTYEQWEDPERAAEWEAKLPKTEETKSTKP